MNKSLLDTDIDAEVFRAVNATANARTCRQAHGRLNLSVITIAEMVKGLQEVQRPQKMAALLTHVSTEEVLEFAQPTAEMAGRIWGNPIEKLWRWLLSDVLNPTSTNPSRTIPRGSAVRGLTTRTRFFYNH